MKSLHVSGSQRSGHLWSTLCSSTCSHQQPLPHAPTVMHYLAIGPKQKGQTKWQLLPFKLLSWLFCHCSRELTHTPTFPDQERETCDWRPELGNEQALWGTQTPSFGSTLGPSDLGSFLPRCGLLRQVALALSDCTLRTLTEARILK